MKLTLHTDGGSRGNPGHSAGGYVLHDKKQLVDQGGAYIGIATCNEAEYYGLIQGIEAAGRHGATSLRILCDSKLVVMQVRGKWKAKKSRLKILLENVIEALKPFEFTITHVRRDKNAEADAIVNEILDSVVI